MIKKIAAVLFPRRYSKRVRIALAAVYLHTVFIFTMMVIPYTVAKLNNDPYGAEAYGVMVTLIDLPVSFPLGFLLSAIGLNGGVVSFSVFAFSLVLTGGAFWYGVVYGIVYLCGRLFSKLPG